MAKLSVVIPTYNRAGLVKAAVDSVLKQTWTAFEIIVVDDGSSDESKDVLGQYGNRIRYFQRDHEGPSQARNFGAAQACGEFLAFLDSDDVWEPNKLDVQMAFLGVHPEIKMVCCGTYRLGQSPKRRSPLKGDRWGDLFLTLFEKSFVNTSSVVLDRACFLQVGAFDETIRTAEDYDLWLRVARRFPVAYLDRPLVGIRKHRDELSKNKVELRRNAIRVVERHFDPHRVPRKAYRKRIADLHVYLGRGYLRIGDTREARVAFQNAMRQTPFRVRPVRYFLRSLWVR
jgi:glycosyltransferase involved in cell wall biosynthesis